MQKRKDASQMYACMQPNELRRVDHPHDEHPPHRKGRGRRVLGKLAAMVRS